MKLIKKSEKLANLMSLGALNGNITLFASSGLLTIKEAPLLAFSVIAGPASIIVASNIGGSMKERLFASLIAGLIATLLVISAATIGTKLMDIVNFKLLQIIGGFSIILIGLTMMGMNIPSKFPFIAMILGLIISIIWR